MTYEEFEDIYVRAGRLTKSGKLKWKRADEGTFTASFTRASLVVSSEAPGSSIFPFFAIFNDEGLMIAYASSRQMSKVPSAAKYFDIEVSDLLEEVRNAIYKYDSTAASLLEDLEAMDT